MPLQATSGAASYDGFGGGVAVVPTYIEDVFSTYLYTGNGSTQTITNGIDLAGEGGLVWFKSRNNSTFANSPHVLTDSVTGFSKYLISSATTQQQSWASDAPVPSSTGFSLPPNGFAPYTNYLTGGTYASWTFRKQPKFFDVVTWTGTGTSQTIIHALGSAPGCIMVKRTDTTGDWLVYHRGLTSSNAAYGVKLNTTDAETLVNWFNFSAPTSTQFLANGDANISGGTYVAYLFAHNAGGFGLTGTDNVISCGSFTTSGGGGDATVNLGYEPQWLLVKSASGTSGWDLMDNMRGMPNYGTYGSATALEANNSNAEGSRNPNCYPTSTGFYYARAASTTYIYIAIRRGPMRVPTSGTSVFAPVALPSPGPVTNTLLRTTNFPVDFYLAAVRNQTFNKFAVGSRLQGKDAYLSTNLTNQENAYGDLVDNLWDNNTGLAIVDTNCSWNGNDVTQTTILEAFRRAPSFFDEVCYTGTGSATTFSHNLQAVPELMIFKKRNGGSNWSVYSKSLSATDLLYLSYTNGAGPDATVWNSTAPTSSVFSVGTSGAVNTSGGTYVAYLFATCAGVSKVGSYTGTGTTQTINCGFTAGARFVLIKRTDSTGDWYVWDAARGIVSGNDPYLLLNSVAAEVTSTDYIDPVAAGFEITSTAPAAINASGGTFIFLAIA